MNKMNCLLLQSQNQKSEELHRQTIPKKRL